MGQANQPNESSVIAVYHNHESAERAFRRLHEDGFDMRNVSIVGRDFQVEDEPVGFVTTGDCAAAGAEIGAFVGGIFGLCVGMAFLILPGLGFVIVAGPIAAALVGGEEGALAGAVIGGLAGALVGWGVPGVHARKYETHVKEGKFLVLARGDSETIGHAKQVLQPEGPDQLETYKNGANSTRG
jgi:hypothetical protein